MIATSTKPTICLLLALGVALAGSAVASDIYKWTDANGNVHYGDRPAEDVAAERLDIQSRPTDRARVAAIVQARAETREQVRTQASADSAEQPSPEELRAAAEERAQKCDMYKERLQTFIQSRRLYREDDNGERVYLSEEETLQARNNVQSKVEEYCTP